MIKIKNIILKYKENGDDKVSRKLLNTILRHEGLEKELIQENTLSFLEELTSSIANVVEKHGLSEKDAATVLHVVAHSSLHDDFQ